MPLFDGYVVVDWSAKVDRKAGKNSVWIAACDSDETLEVKNLVTRWEAMICIERLLRKATAAYRRLLCGFDFSFGYPEGTARVLTGRNDWAAVWSLIAKVIKDRPDNWNNRFDAAAELNRLFERIEGTGPFWGNQLKRDVPDLSRKKPQAGWGVDQPRRLAEREVPKAQEVWKLVGNGQVGGQALTGIAALERLRGLDDVDVRVWPFETFDEGQRSHVLAEIYPSMIKCCPKHRVKDEGQVCAVATTLQELDKTGDLRHYLHAPRDMPPRVRHEEGAILGMHDPQGFEAARQRVRPCC